MLEIFSGHQKQLGVTLAVMNEVPKFRRDNKTPSWLDGVLETSIEVRSQYLTKDAELKTARAQLHLAWDLGHQAAISVYPTLQSIYRNDPVASETISKLPVDDRTPAETLTRLESISKAWTELPNMPGTNKTFVVGEMDQAALDGLAAALRAKIKAVSKGEVQFTRCVAALNLQDKANASFIAAALKQGRGQFAEGTAERKLVEEISTESSSPSETPEKPVVTDAAPKAAAGVSPTVVAPGAPATEVDFVEPPKAANQ